MNEKLKKVIAGVAPTIAGALGGPLAGVAVGALSKALLGHDQGTLEELAPQLGTLTAEQSAALYAADRELRAELARLDFKRDELVVQDRQNARAREAAYVAAGKQDLRGDVLAFSAVAALCGSICLAFFVDLSQDQQLLVAGLIGSLTVIVKDVYSHHFGSSRGSESKTDAIMRGAGR